MDRRHDLVETIFHGITLLAYCGGGAFGDVYYGKDVTGRGLAVKVVPKARLGDHWERELKGVVQYRRITENAPELLKIYHVEETGDEFFYTMEPADSAAPDRYVPDTLAGRLGKGAIPPNDLFGILTGIFSGIRAIHAAGFAHRDIKPENILFVGGVPKLGDIGLISSLSSSMTTLAGTLEYIPPEMRTDDRTSTDRASRQRNDLYAFGKVVYCAVTGEDAGRWPEVPPELPAVLPVKLFLRLALRLCSKDPVRRIATVAELGREFAEIEHQLKYGETWRDRVRCRRRELFSGARSALHKLGRGLRRYWYAVPIALVFAGGGIWYLREQYAEPLKKWSKTFEFQPAGVTLTIPMHWEYFSRDIIQQKLPSSLKDPELPEQRKHLLEMLKIILEKQPNFLLITCDMDDQMADNISIQTFPPDEKKRRDLPDEVLRSKIQEIMAATTGQKAKIESIRRHEMAGYPCLDTVLVSSVTNQRIRTLSFELEDRAVVIALSAKLTETYPVRKQEFDSVLKTLKIRKKL